MTKPAPNERSGLYCASRRPIRAGPSAGFGNPLACPGWIQTVTLAPLRSTGLAIPPRINGRLVHVAVCDITRAICQNLRGFPT